MGDIKQKCEKNMKQWKTTVPGMIILLGATVTWFLSFFMPVLREVSDWNFLVAAVFGAVLIISPSKFLGMVEKKVK